MDYVIIPLLSLIVAFFTLVITYVIKKDTNAFNKYLKNKKMEEENKIAYRFRATYSHALAKLQKQLDKETEEDNSIEITILYFTDTIIELYNDDPTQVYTLLTILQKHLEKIHGKRKGLFKEIIREIKKETKNPYFPTITDYDKKTSLEQLGL